MKTASAWMSNPTMAGMQARNFPCNVLSYAVLLGGLLTIIVSIYMVVTSYSSLPFWDGWDEFRFAANGGSLFSLAWLTRLHNEHPIAITKLFLATDLRLFAGRQTFLLASTLVIQLIHVALLSWSMYVLGGWRGVLWRTGTGLTAFCLFCPSQYENFVWGFQVGFVLPQLFASLCFVGLVLYWNATLRQAEKYVSSEFLLMSVLAALGVANSLATGTVLWPLLVAAALYLRLRLKAVLSYAIVGTVSTAFYAYHFVSDKTHTDPLPSLGGPLKLFHYCSMYFLSSWGIENHSFSIVLRIGLLLLLVPVLSFIRNFRPFAIQLVLTMWYCLATAFITAIGRSNLGISQAASSRYQSVALLFWCSLGLLWLGAAFSAGPRLRHGLLIGQVGLVMLFARGAVNAKDPIRIAHGHLLSQNAASAALLTGVLDPLSLGEVYPEYWTDLENTARYMKANRLSVFSDTSALYIGKPLESVFPIAGSSSCSGALESVAAVDNPRGSGMRVLGWAWDRLHQRLPSKMVVTINGMIAGMGTTGSWAPFVHPVNPGLPSRPDGFVALSPTLPPGSTASIYAILGESRAAACYIAPLTR